MRVVVAGAQENVEREVVGVREVEGAAGEVVAEPTLQRRVTRCGGRPERRLKLRARGDCAAIPPALPAEAEVVRLAGEEGRQAARHRRERRRARPGDRPGEGPASSSQVLLYQRGWPLKPGMAVHTVVSPLHAECHALRGRMDAWFVCVGRAFRAAKTVACATARRGTMCRARSQVCSALVSRAAAAPAPRSTR